MKNASYKRDFKWHWHGTPCLVTEMYEINFPLNKQNCPRPVYVPIETTCMEPYMNQYSAVRNYKLYYLLLSQHEEIESSLYKKN